MKRIWPLLFFIITLNPTVDAQEVLDSFIILDEFRVNFDSNVHTLDSIALSKLDSFLLIINERPDAELLVEAHTDDVGSDAFNQALSNRRMNSVVEWLIANKIDSSRISSGYYGETSLQLNGIDSLSRSINRRATIQMRYPQKYIQLKGEILDEDTQKGIAGDVYLRTRGFNNSTRSDSLGRFEILAPLNRYVFLEVESKGFFMNSKGLKVTPDYIKKAVTLPLPKIEKGKTIELKELLFIGNTSTLLRRSYTSLTQLKRFMFVNTDVCIEIKGHINKPYSRDVSKSKNQNVSTTSGNYELSVARALKIRDELVSVGVNSDRMLAKGYGNWHMVYPYARDAKEQQSNRRVEMEVMSCDSTTVLLNDLIEDKKRYEKLPLDRSFESGYIDRDLVSFPERYKQDLMKKVRLLRQKGMDPSQLTYGEILRFVSPN